MTDHVKEAKQTIKSCVKDYFVKVRGFKRDGRHFFKNFEGVQHAAFLDQSSWSPYFTIMYSATLLEGPDEALVGPTRHPDLEGDLGWLSGRQQGPLDLMDATNDIPLSDRASRLTAFLTEDAEKWFSQVADVQMTRERIKRSVHHRDENFLPYKKALEKLGLI